MPGSSAYIASQEKYYDLIQLDVSPACVAQPSTAEEVATIVKAATDNDIPFAIHSGGHIWIPEGSNIGGQGFTLDLVNLQQYELADDKKSLKLGPGWRWGPIFTKLAEQNLHVIGGRDSDVGVGGFLLGGTSCSALVGYSRALTTYLSHRWHFLPFLRARHRFPEHH